MSAFHNSAVAILILLSFTGNLFAEVYHTFNSNRLRVICGESGKSGTVNLLQTVDVNEPFAVALGWQISFDGNTRQYYHQEPVTAGALDYPPHTGNGGGYNEAGFQLIVERYSNNSGGYTYFQHVKKIYPNTPCVDDE